MAAKSEGRVYTNRPIITFEGKNYFDALAKLNTDFLKSKWGDGLPVLPATEEYVKCYSQALTSLEIRFSGEFLQPAG